MLRSLGGLSEVSRGSFFLASCLLSRAREVLKDPGDLEASWGPLGALKRARGSWDALGSLLERSWTLLERKKVIWDRSWAVLGRPWTRAIFVFVSLVLCDADRDAPVFERFYVLGCLFETGKYTKTIPH